MYVYCDDRSVLDVATFPTDCKQIKESEVSHWKKTPAQIY